MNSTHQALVYPVTLKKHPNGDNLSIINIEDYTYVANTVEWENVVKAVWIPPDNIVDLTLPNFVGFQVQTKDPKNYRIRAKKIRGIVSYGLMVPVPCETPVGEDWTEKLQVHHWNPVESSPKGISTKGEQAKPPTGVFYKYDVDAFLAYGRKVLIQDEPLYVTEKIHGANGRFIYQNGQMFCGSRTEWKKEFSSPPKVTEAELRAKNVDEERIQQILNKVKNAVPEHNLWWKVYRQYEPSFSHFLQENEGFCLYGEVYGQVQDLKYGTSKGEVRFAAFDILDRTGNWLSALQFRAMCVKYNIPSAPVLHYALPFNFDTIVSLAEGNSLIPGAENQIREGIVVKPLEERWDAKIGRVALKCINPAYIWRKVNE